MIVTLVKLAFAGLRTRLLVSVITLLLAATAASTIVVALEVGATARDPWQRTFEAAHGAHALVSVATQAEALAVARLPGIAEVSPPLPLVRVDVHIDGEERLLLAALPPDAAVNVPIAIDGTTTPGVGIVVERSLADALGLDVGDRLRVGNDTEVEVVGTAIVPSQSRYPRSNPGLAWVAESTLLAVQPDTAQWHWELPVRLTDPDSAPQFASDIHASLPGQEVFVTTWQDQRTYALQDSQPITLLLSMFTIVTLVVVLMVIGLLVGARADQQRREIGLVRAIGLTPRQVAAIFALETTSVALIGVVLGSVAGFFVAPLLAAPAAATLLGAPEMEPDVAHAVIAAVPVLLVFVVGSWSSTRRLSRGPVMQSIRSDAGRRRPHSALASISRLLGAPLTITLGVKDLSAQRGRTRLLGATMLTAGAALTFALCMKASLDRSSQDGPSDVPAELPTLVYTLDAILLVIAFATLVAVATLAVRQRTREFAVMKTIGLTPRQARHSVVGAHVVVAAIAGIAAIPVGIALFISVYRLSGGETDQLTLAPWPWLIALPVVIAGAAALATDPPARIATHASIADALHHD